MDLSTPIRLPQAPGPGQSQRRIVVVGGSSPIGKAVLRTAQSQGRTTVGTYCRREVAGLVPLDLVTGDIGALGLTAADAVLLLATHSDLNWVYENPDAARALNVGGVLRAANAAVACGARVILLSTELVFDGVRGAYAETDPTDPGTLYGRQMVEAEEAIRGLSGSWAVARTGWNVGWEKDPRCGVFMTYKTLLQRGARMAEDHVFTLTDVNETALALLALADSQECGVWHIAGAPALSRSDLADWVAETSRHRGKMHYERVRFAELPYPEPRPERSWIVNHKAVQKLQLTFAEPWRTVERKVALIDQWYDERQARLETTARLQP